MSSTQAGTDEGTASAQADMDIAVVVQGQIETTRAGVMFTIDPATGAEDRLVIEATFGLGESVVSGAVSPDRYVVSKNPLAIERREVHRKEIEVIPAADAGTLTRELTHHQGEQPVLSDEEAEHIAEIGLRIEARRGARARPRRQDPGPRRALRARPRRGRLRPHAGGNPRRASGDLPQ